MDIIAGELGAIIVILLMIGWDLGRIRKHLKGKD
jgi:hypothetical protein